MTSIKRVLMSVLLKEEIVLIDYITIVEFELFVCINHQINNSTM